MRTVTGRAGFIVDGVPARAVRGFVQITDHGGRIRKLRLRGFPFDPCPRVEIDGVIVDAFPRLPTWVSGLCAIPLLLILGGAAPAVLGVFAAYGNFRAARSKAPAPIKLAVGALATAAAVATSIAIASMLRVARH
jgi:hypothetical protein